MTTKQGPRDTPVVDVVDQAEGPEKRPGEGEVVLTVGEEACLRYFAGHPDDGVLRWNGLHPDRLAHLGLLNLGPSRENRVTLTDAGRAWLEAHPLAITLTSDEQACLRYIAGKGTGDNPSTHSALRSLMAKDLLAYGSMQSHKRPSISVMQGVVIEVTDAGMAWLAANPEKPTLDVDECIIKLLDSPEGQQLRAELVEFDRKFEDLKAFIRDKAPSEVKDTFIRLLDQIKK